MLKKMVFLPLCFLMLMICSESVKAENNDTWQSPISFDIQLMSWKQIDSIIPRYSKFTLIDVESGKLFHVQRRAGSQHADVQPITPKDTKIMKDIYNGKWSWKRRAIIIMVEDNWYAASMHGMPHGAGALNNQFPGHFCVHFLGSTTHKSDKMDFSHMLMVYKAAGELEDHLNHLQPDEVVKAYIAGIKEQDTSILEHITIRENWDQLFTSIENIKLREIDPLEHQVSINTLQLDIKVELDVYEKNNPSHREKKNFQLIRYSPLEPWKIAEVTTLSK